MPDWMTSTGTLCRIAATALGALALTHCAHNPVSGGWDVALMSEQQEVQAGAQGHEDVLKTYGAVQNPGLQAYIDEVGQRLAAQSELAQLKWRFTVVDSPDVNAFALPGGYVYVTRGLLAYLNTEAELAGVLSHEIAHVTARHGVQHGATTAAGPGAALGSLVLPGLDKQAAASLLQTLGQAWTAGYGREHELEADRLGAEYLARAGYSPQAMIDVIGVLKTQEQFTADEARGADQPIRTYHGTFDTHPSNDKRLQQVVAEAQQSAVADAREGRREYLERLAGVHFGDSPEQGLIRGNLLLHEKLGLAMQFPPGWQVQNRPERVVAFNPERDALVELQVGPQHDRPLETLKKVKLDAGARYDSGELSGYPAAFAAGAQQGKPAVVAAVAFRGTQYVIAGMALDQAAYLRERAALRGAINSFRAMTAAEKRAVRPYVLKIIPAPAGMTMAKLAKKSPLGGGAERQLRLMNGLYPNGEPRRGQLLKIVQ